MCLGIPGRIVEFVDTGHQIAKAEVSGVRRNINVGLVLPDGLEIGDWVLIHVGFALSKIDEDEAKRTIAYLTQLDDLYVDEVRQIVESRIE
ncbi:MAG: HypC/HybG/HupF family hydrogenase formation chaperone [Gemmatimonadota bacterium]|nr:HypC/HybG/HupF family hydrogenase formation chaperone [Gemmatimonadota bacterium]